MSSHFNYEIDERNLRVRLKDMSLPYKEEAWIQFENYTGEHQVTIKRTAIPSFSFSINRTVVLPVVFGAVIILFSFLLFNFISIKNKAGDAKQETASFIPPKTQTQKEIIPPTEKKPETASVTAVTDTVAETKTESITPLPSTTPTVASNVNTVAITTPSVTSEAAKAPAGSWTSIEALPVYESPDIASKVLGSSETNKNYTALEETNYFIKISYNGNQTGYVRKHLMRKNGQSYQPVNLQRKKRTAEVLESIQVPVKVSEEKEPELR